MIEKPFLLDPGYEGMLDSSAFRQRFFDLNVGKATRLLFLWPYLPGVFFLVFILVMSNDAEATQFAHIGLAVMAGFFALVALIMLLHRLGHQRNRRLAWEGELVVGRLTSCLRKTYSDSAYSSYGVEVKYEAVTADGLRVQGTQAIYRDDLLNETLPAAGTPVLVLVLDDTIFRML